MYTLYVGSLTVCAPEYALPLIGAIANVFIEMMLYMTGTDSRYNMATDLKMRLPRTHICTLD